MENLKATLKSLMEYVSRMTASQVMMLFGILAGTIVGAVFVVGWINGVTYSQLYSNIGEQDAGEIVSYLESNKIPFRLSQGGKTIEVPSDQVYQARISLASDGLPSGGNMGYSIFDENQLGMTDFLQNLNFRRALEGELTRTIMQLTEVQAARVHLVMPKERLFKKDQNNATASVVLKLKGGSGISKRQIKGITHLVASSVEGLTPDNIAIVDYNGDLLSSGQESDPVAGLSASQLEVRKNVEGYLENKAGTMLADVLGAGKAVVRVTADLDFQQLEKTSEVYDANAPAIRSEERVKSSSTASDKNGEANENEEEGSSETVVTNYELNKTVEHLVNAAGSIKRMSIAVMVDGIYTPVENEDGDTEMAYQPRAQEELDRLSAIVKSAVGFDQQRNDQLEMVNIAFDRQNMDQDRDALDSMYMREFYMHIGEKVGLFLLIAFLFLFIKKKAGKLFQALGKLTPPRIVAVPEKRTERETVEPEPVAPIVPEHREHTLVDQMQETAKDQPEEIAKVIRTMMVE
jgi:flagellar M-ring protein FliF